MIKRIFMTHRMSVVGRFMLFCILSFALSRSKS